MLGEHAERAVYQIAGVEKGFDPGASALLASGPVSASGTPIEGAAPEGGRARVAWLLLALALLLAHARAIAFLNDDAFISFRYAKNWVAGHGLVFNPGERVEGYTNFLWTILIGVLMRLGADPPIAARAMGYLASAGTILAAGCLARRTSRDGGRGVPIAALLLAASSPLAYWTFAGLETPLFTLLLAVALLRATRPEGGGSGGGGADVGAEAGAGDGALARAGRAPDAVLDALPLALLALTRPEGAFVFIVLLAWRVAGGARRGWAARLRGEVPFVLAFLVVYAPYFIWRALYYGYLFPNTFYVRQGRTLAENVALWGNGVSYVAGFVRDGGGALLLVPVALLAGRRGAEERQRGGGLLAALVGIWVAYLVLVGGDAKILYRFFVPVLPAIYVLVEAGLREVALAVRGRATPGPRDLGNATPRRDASAPFRAACAGSLVVLMFLAAAQSLSPPEKYRVDRTFFALLEEGGRWLAKNAPRDATVACFAVGALPYYAGLTTYDLLGVTDAHIAHGPLAAGQMTGHGKTDWDYVLAKRPTFIFPPGAPDLSAAGYEYAPISLRVRGELLTLRSWRRVGN